MSYPITPPPELVQQWRTAPEYANSKQMFEMVSVSTSRLQQIATQAANWGADKELKACAEWMKLHLHSGSRLSRQLRTARRPKPPSLAEQALKALQDQLDTSFKISSEAQERANTIRAALERLQELEQSND